MSNSVAVVDDHPMFREGVCHVLTTNGFHVVGEGATAGDAITLVSTFEPDLLVLDLSLPGGGLEAIEAIIATGTRTAVLVLTVMDDEETVLTAIRSGARGYLLKGIGGNELVEGVRTIARGDLCVASPLMGALLRSISGMKPQTQQVSISLSHFTEREEQLLMHLSHGRSNKEIALVLKLSEKTIKFYITRLLRKLHLRNRTEAALFAVKRLNDSNNFLQ
jgi:two-component system nitrate/nitrite response regulator NarL